MLLFLATSNLVTKVRKKEGGRRKERERRKEVEGKLETNERRKENFKPRISRLCPQNQIDKHRFPVHLHRSANNCAKRKTPTTKISKRRRMWRKTGKKNMKELQFVNTSPWRTLRYSSDRHCARACTSLVTRTPTQPYTDPHKPTEPWHHSERSHSSPILIRTPRSKTPTVDLSTLQRPDINILKHSDLAVG